MTRKGWEKRGKRALTRGLSRVLRARGERGERPDFAELDSILLVRQHNQLGDMLLSTPVFRAVRARAPRARIDLISGPANHEAICACAHVDEVLCYDKWRYLRDPRAAKRFADRIRAARYDLVLVLGTVSFSYTSVWLAALAGARSRAGRPGPGGRGESTARDLFHWVLPPPVPGRHQTGVNLDLVTPFGADDSDWSPEMFLRPADEAQGRSALDEALGDGATGAGLRVVLHPGAGKRPNRWAAERFGVVARALLRGGHRVTVATGAKETELASRVDAGAGLALPRLPPLSFHALGGAIRAADLLLANDTGVLHLGASVGTPVLALFGPTDPDQWCPAAPRVWYLQAPGGDLANLDVGPVESAALEVAGHLLGRPSPRGARPAPARVVHPGVAP